MINYEGGLYGFNVLFRFTGSVLPSAAFFAITPAILIPVLVYTVYGAIGKVPVVVIAESTYTRFTWVLAFVLTFRTGIAFNRYWEGINELKRMGIQWYDACKQILAFTQVSGKPEDEIFAYQACIVQIFSLMHGCALQSIADMEDEDFDVLDYDAVDDDHLERLAGICDPSERVEILCQWTQLLILHGLGSNMIKTPPPIVSRSFQQLSLGLEALGRLDTIRSTPFPFPYAQFLSALLLVYSVATPIVTMGTSNSEGFIYERLGRAFFGFVSVFSLMALNLIASEIEAPFGDDPNDLDTADAQIRMNAKLSLLLTPCARSWPSATGASVLPTQIEGCRPRSTISRSIKSSHTLGMGKSFSHAFSAMSGHPSMKTATMKTQASQPDDPLMQKKKSSVNGNDIEPSSGDCGAKPNTRCAEGSEDVSLNVLRAESERVGAQSHCIEITNLSINNLSSECSTSPCQIENSPRTCPPSIVSRAEELRSLTKVCNPKRIFRPQNSSLSIRI